MIIIAVGSGFLTCAAIDIAYVTATEDITEAVGNAGRGAHLTAEDAHFGLSEDVTLGTEVHGLLLFIGHITFTVPVVEASATAKDITQHMTTEQGYPGATRLVDLRLAVDEGIVRCCSTFLHRTTTDRSDLTAAIKATTDDTAIHLDIGEVDITVGHITATEDITASVEQVVTGLHVVEFLHIFIILIAIADASVVDGDISRAEDATTLAAAVDITLNGRNAIEETGSREVTDDDMGIAATVTRIVGHIADESLVITHATTPATAVDITYHTTIDISISRGGEACGEDIGHTTGGTCRIDILYDRAAEQGNIGRAIDTTCQCIRFRSISATIDITADSSTFMDDHVGVIPLIYSGLLVVRQLTEVTVIHISHPDKWISEVGICIADISCELSHRIIITIDGPCGHPFLFPGFLIIVLESATNSATDPSILVTPRVGIFVGHHFCRLGTIELQVLLHTLGIEHITQLTATIDFPDIGALIEVHLGVFRPSIVTTASAIDGA